MIIQQKNPLHGAAVLNGLVTIRSRLPAWTNERFSSSDFAGLKDVDGLGELSGAPGAAAELAQDAPRP